MCGRFTLHIPPELIAEIFGAPLPDDFRPRFNVAPGQNHPVLLQTGEGRLITHMRWGLIPHWSQDPRLGFSMINARSETLDSKPAFRGSFKSRRCLVIADGFYEWRHEGKEKEPFYLSMREGGVMPIAGLWDRWADPDGDVLDTFTVITCAANGLVQKLHDRMPVIIDIKDSETWLNPAVSRERVKELLRPYPSDRMRMWKVASLVNNSRNESEECIRRV